MNHLENSTYHIVYDALFVAIQVEYPELNVKPREIGYIAGRITDELKTLRRTNESEREKEDSR